MSEGADAALMRLAKGAGIEHGYWDGLGTWRGLTELTARRLLTGLGFDPDGDCEAQLQSLEDESFRQPLPPVLVVRSQPRVQVQVVLPVESAGTTVEWLLTLESGVEHRGSFTPAAEGARDARPVDGLMCARFGLTFENDMPLGYHRLALPSLQCSGTLIVVPDSCFIPPELLAGGRCWGMSVQLYALRSARNWGIGDFTDLARIASITGQLGAALVGVNPLHARHLARPAEASPYAPSSRLFLDAMYLDVEAIPDFADCRLAQSAVADPSFQARLAEARAAPLVDHPTVTALKLPVLRLLFDLFWSQTGDTGRTRAFDEFRQRGGPALANFTEFEALRLDLLERHGDLPGFADWPAGLRDPSGASVARFREDAADAIAFQAYLQWQAALQLAAAAEAGRASGMSIGLYCDLAVGAARDGAEHWSDKALAAPGLSVGAPPDLLSRQGQDWGLPPWNPRALAARAYRPFAALLAANMQFAGALRIDHVMALTRLFWIPSGMSGSDGAYVSQAFDALAGIVALESVRNRCLVIGEDLGSVPDGLRERLADLGLLSYRVLIFERHWDGDGSFKRPWEYPSRALATVATHDMPTIAEYWQSVDVGRRDALGMFPGAEQRDQEIQRRDAERPKILALLGELGLLPADSGNPDQVIEALHGAAARTKAMLAVVQIDDLLGETSPINIPGTYREYPNWRRKLSRTLDEIEADPRLARLAAIMREAGRA